MKMYLNYIFSLTFSYSKKLLNYLLRINFDFLIFIFIDF